MRTSIAVLFILGLTFTAEQAFAQEFSDRKDLAISVDRVFGFHLSHMDRDNPNQDFDTTSVEFGWGGRSTTPFDVPRVAIDYFVIDHLSIGGSLGIADYSGDASGHDFLFAPRVGYVWNLASWVSFWLRGGFTYHSSGTPDEHGFALTGEPTFVFTPAPHVGVLAGLTLDQDLFGRTEVGGGPGDRDQRFRDIAIVQAGMLIWF